MILDPKCNLEKYDIDLQNCFIIVDKDKNPDLYLKSIMLYLNTQQAIEIIDYLSKQVEKHPENNIAVGLLLHTGMNG